MFSGLTNIRVGTLVIGMMIASLISSGQNPYFLKAIEVAPGAEGYSGMVVEDSTIVLLGTTYSNGYARKYLVRTNMQGDTVQTRSYFNDSSVNFHSGLDRCILRTHNGYILCGRDESLLGFFQPSLMKVDINGDTVWTRTYFTDSLDGEFVGMVWSQDSTVMCYGTIQTDTTVGARSILVVEHDTNGLILWDTTYNIGFGEATFSMDTTTDGGYILSGSYGGTWDTFIIKINSTGISEWTKFYSHSDNENGYILTLKDSGYFLFGGTGTVDGRFCYSFLLNNNGDSLWSHYYQAAINSQGEEYFSAIQTNDYNVVLAGASVDPTLGDPTYIMTKLNISSGETIWFRRHQIRNNDHYPWALRKTSRESILMAGYIFPDGTNNTQDGLLGHFSCLGYTELPSADFNWYNLGNNQINLENLGGYADEYLWDFGDGWTYYHESDPQQISSDEPFVSHTYQAPGTYTVTLYAIACQDTSMSTQTVTVDPMGVEDHIGESRLKVYPNPTNGEVTVETMVHGRIGNARLEVISTTGQLVYNQPVSSRGDKAILKFEGLSSGIYFVTLKVDGSVRNVERVVKY